MSKIYTNIIRNQIINDFLKRGIVPQKMLIDSEFSKRIANNPNLDKPFLSKDQYTLSPNETTSASKANETIEDLILDFSALYQSAVDMADISTSFTEKVYSKFKSLEKDIQGLDSNTTNLLLLAQDVEGYLNCVSDSFSDNSKVDLPNCTVSIDNKSQAVVLPIEIQSQLNFVPSDSDIQFNVLSRAYFNSDEFRTDAAPINAFLNKDKFWVQRASYRSPIPEFSGELIFRLPSASSFSKIIISPISSDKGRMITVRIQYGNDGLNWTDVDGESSKRLVTDTSFLFKGISPAYVRFIFSKVGYDDFTGDLYYYEIGLKAIEFYGIEFSVGASKVSEGHFYSEPLTMGKYFNKVSLKTCEYVPVGTSIDYSVSMMTDSEYSNYTNGTITLDDLSFSDIDPVNRTVQVHPLIVDGTKIDRLYNYGSVYPLDSSTSFKYKDNINNVLIDTYSIGTNTPEDGISVWRNLGDNTIDGGSHSSTKVNNIDSGWLQDGDYYSCEFYITDTLGKIIDFGQSTLEIDGTKATGRVNLEQGKHRIKTYKDSWYGLSPSSIASSTSPNPDILYPFNHKYLIEGVKNDLYGVDMTVDLGSGKTKKLILDPNGVYTGADKYWARTLSLETIFDFAYNIEDDNYFVYSIVDDINLNRRILIKYNPKDNLFALEKFAIIENRINGSLYKYIILNAEFKSSDNTKTPVLSGYYIRMGY